MAYGVAFCLSIFCLRCRYEFMMLDLAMRRSHDVIFLHWLEEQAKTSQPFSCHCHFSWTPKIIFLQFFVKFPRKESILILSKKTARLLLQVQASIGSQASETSSLKWEKLLMHAGKIDNQFCVTCKYESCKFYHAPNNGFSSKYGRNTSNKLKW